MWITTWLAIAFVVGWIVAGMILSDGTGPLWVTLGAILLAAVVPVVSYRYAKALMLRLLFRFDPPEAT